MEMISIVLGVVAGFYLIWCLLFWVWVGMMAVAPKEAQKPHLAKFNECVSSAKKKFGFFGFSFWCLILFLLAPIAKGNKK
jgi:hypothetical protein